MAEIAAGPRVLVVDDDPKILGIYQELLSQHGFTVTVCADGTHAVPLLKADHFDIVVLDIRVPGMDGADLLPLSKRIHPEVPVIVVSAYCESEHAGYYYALGAFELLRKPFSHEVLLQTLTRALNQQQQIPLVLTSLSLREGRDQVYRKLILAGLRKTNWNVMKTAGLLGVSRYCLMRWMKKLGVSA